MTTINVFRQMVWDYYHDHGRELPWRDDATNPYKVMVSEVMLQQTQVTRVLPKYQQFLKRFPDVQALAASSFADVLAVWTGLGYNRRAKFLLQAAQAVAEHHDGEMPHTVKELSNLSGIGVNTAGAIMAYAFNAPVIFIETNIRTVFIHHFFEDQTSVSDAELLAYVEQALDHEHPREWYWALMDYGTYLKATIGNRSRDSKHYKKQSAFVGSKRQLRAQVLRLLLAGRKTAREVANTYPDDRLDSVLAELEGEQLIIKRNNYFTLT